MEVEVYLSGYHVDEDDVRDKTVVVIDVLRTSTTAAAALHNGARAVVPAADMAEAGKIAANLDPTSYTLGGERSGLKIEGYRFGNSPLEYTRDTIGGKTLILNTTNGTPTIRRCRHAANLVIGGFVNLRLVADFLRDDGHDVVIVCAGWRSRVSLEDTLCAGMLLHELWGGFEPSGTSDTGHIAFTLFTNEEADIPGALRRSTHGRRLMAMGRADDVAFCASVDTVPVLPVYGESRLTAREIPESVVPFA